MRDGQVIELSQESFEDEVMASSIPVLVEFGADWCSPCRRLTPMLAEIAEETADRAKVCTVDIDAHTALRDRFQISAIPTVVVFREGQIVRKLIGVMSKAELVSALDEAVGV